MHCCIAQCSSSSMKDSMRQQAATKACLHTKRFRSSVTQAGVTDMCVLIHTPVPQGNLLETRQAQQWLALTTDAAMQDTIMSLLTSCFPHICFKVSKHPGMKVYLTHSPQYIITAHVQLLAVCCCHGIGLEVDCIFGILHLGVPVLCFSTFTASQSSFKVWSKHHR